MPARPAGVVAALRRPAYTGENRCWPCTGVNAAIAIALATVAWRLAPLDAGGSAATGVVVLGLAGVLIYLRGYLVPGTPLLTRTYLPDRVLRHFEHGPTAAGSDGDVDPADLLVRADVVAECDDVDYLCLEDDVRAAWRARMDDLRGTDATRDELAAVLDLPREALTLENHGHAFVAMADADRVEGAAHAGHLRVGQWESEGAFLADVAAAGVLADRVGGWSGLSAVDRGRVLNGLRIFLDACPSCGGPVEIGEETVESCCRSREVVAVTCADCGDRLFEAEASAAA